jgi:hypothetical protein
MVSQLLLGFQALFLILLYLFIWRVMRTASRDLRLPQEGTFLIAAPSDGDVPARRQLGRLVIEQSASLDPGLSFDVGTASLTIGRSRENAIALETDEYTSARHARIEPLRDGIWIVDLGSTNGTYVNGHPIDHKEILREGDVVRVGETELRVER